MWRDPVHMLLMGRKGLLTMGSRGLWGTGLAMAACLALGDAGWAAESRWFTTSDGVQLHYIEGGETNGRTVVLVPGWAMPAWIFDAQIAALESRYHVLALDPRGQGESDVPSFGYTHERRGRDIAELIDHEVSGRVVLVGWSLGVLDSLSMVAAEGDGRLAGLVLIDNSVGEGPAPTPRPTSRRIERIEPSPEQRHAMRAAFVGGMFATDPGEAYRARLTEDALRMSPEQEQQLRNYAVPRTFWRDTLYSTSRPLLYAIRPRLEVQGRAVAAARPDAQVVMFDHAGHALFVDEADRFNGLLIDFLDHRADWADAA